MKSMRIDGYDFTGPYVAGKGEIPAINGIALICSEAGEGVKIIAVEYGDNLCTQIEGSPNMQLWKDNCYHGIIDVYVLEIDPAKRDSVARSMIEKRKNTLTCQKIEAIVDDW